MDCQVVHVQGKSNEVAPGWGREKFEWKQLGDPWMWVDVASQGHEILPIRSPIIERAGEPLRAHFHNRLPTTPRHQPHHPRSIGPIRQHAHVAARSTSPIKVPGDCADDQFGRRCGRIPVEWFPRVSGRHSRPDFQVASSDLESSWRYA